MGYGARLYETLKQHKPIKKWLLSWECFNTLRPHKRISSVNCLCMHELLLYHNPLAGGLHPQLGAQVVLLLIIYLSCTEVWCYGMVWECALTHPMFVLLGGASPDSGLTAVFACFQPRQIWLCPQYLISKCFLATCNVLYGPGCHQCVVGCCSSYRGGHRAIFGTHLVLSRSLCERCDLELPVEVCISWQIVSYNWQ